MRSVRFALEVPEGTDSQAHFVGLLGALLPAIALGIGTMLVPLLLLGHPKPEHPELRTVYGNLSFQPEYDVALYLLGVVVTLVLIAVLTLFNSRRVQRPSMGETDPRSIPSSAKAFIGLISVAILLITFLQARNLVEEGQSVPSGYKVVWALTALVLLAVSWLPTRSDFQLPSAGPDAEPGRRKWPLDVLFGIAILALIYSPSWREISALDFAAEGLLHWDFFAMGPALAFHHGAALGTEAFSYYGIGWPVFFALISPVVKIGYGNMIHIGVIYGCTYFIGVYVLLRLLTKNVVWSAAGTLTAITVQVFSGIGPIVPVWHFPSLTILRRPFDVWIFAALVLYLRSNRRTWMLLAAIFVGASVVFETDTGLYLVAAFGLFLFGLLVVRWKAAGRALVAWSVGTVLVVTLAGLGVGSRWTLLRAAFWTGWLENLRNTSRGHSMAPLVWHPQAPLVNRPGTLTITFFVLITAVYLACLGILIIKLLHRRATESELVLGSLSLYGALAMLQFAGRSDALNVYHLAIPFIVVVVSTLATMHQRFVNWIKARGEGSRTRAEAAAPAYAALAVSVIVLLSNDVFRQYPGLIQTVGSPPATKESCLFRNPIDVCGFPRSEQGEIGQLQRVFAEARKVVANGHSLAVLDHADPVFYLAAGVGPWSRYSPLFFNLTEISQLVAVRAQLARDPFDYVLIRDEAHRNGVFPDTWKVFHDHLEQKYRLESAVGPFELWINPAAK